mmetsp:Transcript_2573/g.9822  ORF Transcript_2573/g.9822 Transcript_2573/m.9822 type:complete len:519 (-) Transcript_2573:154-1710(-)
MRETATPSRLTIVKPPRNSPISGSNAASGTAALTKAPHPSFLSSFAESLLDLCHLNESHTLPHQQVNGNHLASSTGGAGSTHPLAASLTFSPHFAQSILPKISSASFPEMLIQAKRYENEELVRWRSWIERRYARFETEPRVIRRAASQQNASASKPSSPATTPHHNASSDASSHAIGDQIENLTWEEYMTSEIRGICQGMERKRRQVTQRAQLKGLSERLAHQQHVNKVRVSRMVKERRSFLEAARERDQVLKEMTGKLEGLYGAMKDMAERGARDDNNARIRHTPTRKGTAAPVPNGSDAYLTYYENEEEYNKYLAQMEQFLNANSREARKKAASMESATERSRKRMQLLDMELQQHQAHGASVDSVEHSGRLGHAALGPRRPAGGALHLTDGENTRANNGDPSDDQTVSRMVPQLQLRSAPEQQHNVDGLSTDRSNKYSARTDLSYLTSARTSSTRGSLMLKVSVDIGQGEKGEIYIHENDNLHRLAVDFQKSYGLPQKVVPAIVHHITSILDGH